MSGLRASIIITGMAQALTASTTFIQYGLVQRIHGVDGLADFSLAMRVRGILEFLATLMIPMALARQLATVGAGPDCEGRTHEFIRAGTLLGLSGLGLAMLLAAAFPGAATTLLFGSDALRPLLPGFCILLFGYGACLISGAIFRGRQSFVVMNCLQVSYAAIAPVAIIFLCSGRNIPAVLTLLGTSAAALAILFFLVFAPKRTGQATSLRFAAPALSLLKYGAPRTATMVAVAAFGISLPWLLSHTGLGTLLAATNALSGIVSASTLVASPLGVVMLPHLCQQIAAGNREETATTTNRILLFAILGGMAISLAVLAVLPVVLPLWLGEEIAGFRLLVAAAAIAIPAYLILETMRIPIDAVSDIPWNAVTYFTGAALGIATFLLVRLLLPSHQELAAALALIAGAGGAAVACLGIAGRFFPLDFIGRQTVITAAIWLATITASSLARAADRPGWSVALAAGGFAAACGFILLSAPPWMRQLLRRNRAGAGA